MSRSNYIERRQMLKLMTTGLAAIPVLGMANSLDLIKPTSDQKLTVNVFSKHLQFLNYKDMAEAAKEIGFDGVDLTVRKGGHVEPDKVKDSLPLATEAMKSAGISPSIFTTNVLDADNLTDRAILETASQLGYNIYRMGWLKYPDDRTMTQSISTYQQQFKKLAKLNRELGLKGSYQNHSGKYVGSAFWDLKEILSDIPPAEIGSQYDIMHATVDGGTNWELSLRLMKDNINSMAIKDFIWGKVDGQWKPVKTPLGDGMVDIAKFLSIVKKYKLDLPVTMHFEYDLGGAEHGARKLSIDQNEVFSKMKKDLLLLRKLWDSSNP